MIHHEASSKESKGTIVEMSGEMVKDMREVLTTLREDIERQIQ